jgi:hydrogenase expression/formation protein HypC
MCLGVPYEVLKVLEPERALVRVGSGTQVCFTGLVEGVRAGDWVLVHAGVAIETITDEDAQENLRLIGQIIAPEAARVEGSEQRVRPNA